MEIEKILLIILLSVEIAFVAAFLIVYACKSARKAKYEKENRELAIEEILKSAKELCDDNTRILAENVKLKLDNLILEAENKELKEKNDTAGKVYDSNGNKPNKTTATRKSNKPKSDKKVATEKSAGRKKRTTNTLAD